MNAFHSLRTRLTFWYAAMLLAGLVAFAGWMWFAVHQYLAATADERVTRRLQGLHSAIEELLQTVRGVGYSLRKGEE